jgi:hypothetical protein
MMQNCIAANRIPKTELQPGAPRQVDSAAKTGKSLNRRDRKENPQRTQRGTIAFLRELCGFSLRSLRFNAFDWHQKPGGAQDLVRHDETREISDTERHAGADHDPPRPRDLSAEPQVEFHAETKCHPHHGPALIRATG